MATLMAAWAVGTARVSPAHAATWAPLGADNLARGASLVVRGRVLAATAQWLEREGPSRIITRCEIEVREVLAGGLTAREDRHQRVQVGVPGGEVGAFGQVVPGVPTLVVGDELVLFLGPAEGPGGARGLYGLRQGVWRVLGGDLLQPMPTHDDARRGPGAASGPTWSALPELRRALQRVRPR